MSDIKLPELPELRQELERCIYAYADAIEAGGGDEAECQSEFRMLHALDRLEMYAKQAAELERERYEEMRLTLIGQVHELMCAAECGAGWLKSLGLRDDARSIEGAIAHAREVSAPYNYNGRGTK